MLHPDIAAKYADATREELLAVVAAADARWRCWAEFGDHGGACSESEAALDRALASCPGTSPWNFARLPTEGP